MKRKTPNKYGRVPEIQWTRRDRMHEDAPPYGRPEKRNSTSNAQRSIGQQPSLRLGRTATRVQRSDYPVGRRAAKYASCKPRCRPAASMWHISIWQPPEVEAAESRKDFIHKLKICLKELKETRRWLRLIAKSSMLPETKMCPILNETEELIRIFFSSIRTAERNTK